MTGRCHVGKTAPAIRYFLVLGERIGDEREHPQVRREGLGKRLRGLLADLLVGVLQQIKGLLDRKLLAADSEPQPGDRFVEQSIPGAVRGHRFLVKQLLDAVLELIRFLPANVLEPRPIVRERSLPHGSPQRRLVDAIELQREEQEVRGRRGNALLHIAEEFGPFRIAGIAGIDQARVRHEPSDQIIDHLVALDRFGQSHTGVGSARHSGELAFELVLERNRISIRPIEIAPYFRRIHPE